MYIKIHRGTHQIGGNLIEIGTLKTQTRLMFDAGNNLPPLDEPYAEDKFELEGLTYGEPAFDGVFISHHHNDHCGLLKKLLPNIPLFAGDETKRVLNIIADFTNQPRPEVKFCFRDGETVKSNDIRVTPLAVNHSARDAYMFLIQADGRNVLYTGDFREATGIPEKVRELIGSDGKLDALITEGTNIRHEPQEIQAQYHGEDLVTQRATELMRLYPGTVFVLCSSTNSDRVDAITKAAHELGRTVCEDLFMSAIRENVPKGDDQITCQQFVAHYVDRKDTPRIWPYFDRLFEKKALVGAESLAKIPRQKVIFVRTSMIAFMNKYLNTCQEKGNLLIYSMWQGYKEHGHTKKFLDFCRKRNIAVADIHVSGHAYRETAETLINSLSPAALVPIHCDAEDRDEFYTLHDNCRMLNDGELWTI